MNPEIPNEKFIIFYSARCDISAGFYGHGLDSIVIISIPKRFGGELLGLCGDCDGQPNDLRTREGVDVSQDDDMYAKISDSYEVVNDGIFEKLFANPPPM